MTIPEIKSGSRSSATRAAESRRPRWLDDGAACLQPFDAVSDLAGTRDIGPLSGDEKRGWVPGSPEICPKGLIHGPLKVALC